MWAFEALRGSLKHRWERRRVCGLAQIAMWDLPMLNFWISFNVDFLTLLLGGAGSEESNFFDLCHLWRRLSLFSFLFKKERLCPSVLPVYALIIKSSLLKNPAEILSKRSPNVHIQSSIIVFLFVVILFSWLGLAKLRGTSGPDLKMTLASPFKHPAVRSSGQLQHFEISLKCKAHYK